MKFGRIFLVLSYIMCVTFSIMCWTIPFGALEQMGEVVYTDAVHSERVNSFVTSKYNEETKQVDFWWMNAVKIHSVDAVLDRYVWLGGQTLGFDYSSDGVLVVAKGKLSVDEVEIGDVIKSVDGMSITSIQDLSEAINSARDEVMLKVDRKGSEVTLRVKPAFDTYSKRYKLGVWVKDSMNGLGTLTYITEDGSFGALGHPIVETNTNVIMEVENGEVYPCVIFGVQKAGKGGAGELKGTFVKNGKSVGKITKNCEYGLFGCLDIDYFNNKTLVKLGGKTTIHPGKASIFASVDGKNVKEYEIEIIKTNYQSAKTPQNFVFRVLDKDLIALTGGIVQGMSGSPIMQDGLLVGAVTHVFVNDATKGFGTYIDNMINEQ